MPTWISKGGVWEPAPEYAVDPKAPKGKEIYEGPDREAQKELQEQGDEHLGTNLPHPDMLTLARQLGFKTVDEYLETMVPGAKKRSEEAYSKAKGVVETHENPPKKKGINPPSGGDDESRSGKGRKGGFDLPSDVPSARL